MRVLSFDLGTTFGWALQDDGLEEFGEVELVGDEGERYLRFLQLATSMLHAKLDETGFVAFEDVRFSRGASYIPGQRAMLMALCVMLEIPYVGVGVSELKKYATGNGNANKDDMIAAAREIVDYPDLTDNMADAILVGRWALAQQAPDRDRAESEPEASGY